MSNSWSPHLSHKIGKVYSSWICSKVRFGTKGGIRNVTRTQPSSMLTNRSADDRKRKILAIAFFRSKTFVALVGKAISNLRISFFDESEIFSSSMNSDSLCLPSAQNSLKRQLHHH